MSAYDYYKAIRENYRHGKESHLEDKELAALINSCRIKLRANCGELMRLSRPAALEAYKKFLSEGKNAIVTCGKYIYADDSGKNPNISVAEEHGFFGKNAIYHYIPYTPIEQAAYGFLHAFIFDDETVFIEEPHGYIYNVDKKDFDHSTGVLYRDNKELAALIEKWTQAYDDEFAMKEDFRKEMCKTIRPTTDKVWQDKTNCFKTEEDFNRLVVESAKNAYGEAV